MLPSCTALRRVRKAKKQRLHARGRSPSCSVFSMEHPVRWIMTVEICMARYPVLRTDIAPGWSCNIHSPYMFDFCYVWIHELSYLRLYGGIHPSAIFCPLSRRRKKKENHQKKSKRKENNHAPFQSRLGTQMFPSLHKLNGFTSRRHLDIL